MTITSAPAEGRALVNCSTRDDGTTFLRQILEDHALETRHVREILESAFVVE
jgi:hypothetical protein